jgi:hypothetical protein
MFRISAISTARAAAPAQRVRSLSGRDHWNSNYRQNLMKVIAALPVRGLARTASAFDKPI